MPAPHPSPARRRLGPRWPRALSAPVLEWALVVAAVLAGSVLRFTPSTPMWLDEALSTHIAAEPLGEIVDRLRADGHPPLFYWLLHGWMRVFGEGTAAVRAFSGVLGLVAIGLVWRVGHGLAGPRAGRAAAAIAAVSPFAIRYSSEARMYQLVVVLVLAGWLALEAALVRPTVPRLGAVTAVVALALLTHYWVGFLVAAVAVVLIHRARPARPPGQAVAPRRAVVALGLGGVALVPWMPVLVDQIQRTGTPWASPARPTRVVSESLVDFAGGTMPEATLNGYLLVGLAVLGAWAGWSTRAGPVAAVVEAPARHRAIAVVLAATVTIGAVASWVAGTAFASRYASVYFPLFVVLAGAGLATLADHRVRLVVLAALVAFGGAATTHAIVRTDRSQAGEVAEALAARGDGEDLAVVCPDQLGPALARELPVNGPELVRYPDLGDPRFVDWRDYLARFAATDPAAVAEEVTRRRPDGRVWLVWNGGYHEVGPDCDRLADELRRRRPGARVVVQAQPDRYFESASVLELPPGP